MIDLALTLGWLVVLAGAVVVVITLQARGVRSTYLRDLLHIGAGVWVLGWPLWRGWLAPTALVLVVAATTAVVPALATRSDWARRFVTSVTGSDERYAGLRHYTLAFLVLTPIGVLWAPFPAAAGLLALAWGDGPGGAVGRRFGRHSYRTRGAKQKSVEGSVAVMVGAGGGALLAASIFGVAPHAIGSRLWVALGLGVSAALAEALSPRGLDNAIVPAAVFAVALLVMGSLS